MVRPPTPAEKKRILESLRERLIAKVNPDKQSWEELTEEEKKQVDRRCEILFQTMQF